MAKPTKPKDPFREINGVALLGEGAGTVEAWTVGEAKAEPEGVGASAETLSTLISTFCPAWQWPGTPQKKKWWPWLVMLMESLPVVKVAIGDDALHVLYMACVTRITLWNLALYSNTGQKNKIQITNNLSYVMLLLLIIINYQEQVNIIIMFSHTKQVLKEILSIQMS